MKMMMIFSFSMTWMLIIATDMRMRKHLTAIATRKRRIIATDTEAKSLIITMSITTTTDAIWQRSWASSTRQT